MTSTASGSSPTWQASRRSAAGPMAAATGLPGRRPAGWGRAGSASDGLGPIEAFLELHIEQGPRMEAAGMDLAVVTGIVGVYRERVRVVGAQNHAGTTPFAMRRDAGRAAARAVAGLEELVQAIDQ